MVAAAAPSYEERWSPEAIEECCRLWRLTDDQRIALLRLQELVSDLSPEHWKNDPFELVRFLTEFRWNLATCRQKFRDCLEWRRVNRADRILEDYTPPALYNYFPLAVLRGADRDGDPIYIERTGAADTLGLLQRFGKEEMIQQAIWGKELMTRGPWQQQHWPHGRVKQFLTILDLRGLNRQHLHPALVPVGQAVTRLVQDNYPGIGKKILVIRAPFFFRFVWNIFKHFVDPDVKELIEIATESETSALLERYVDLTVLPKEIVPQGRGRAMDGYEVVWEGGPLPPAGKEDRTPRTPVRFTSTPFQSTPTPRTPITPQSIVPDSAHDTGESLEIIVVPSEAPLQTPLQPISLGHILDSGMSWESLPSVSQRRNVQQLWTVTPKPFYDLDQLWSPANVDAMAQLWQISQLEKGQMLQLRDAFRDIQHWKNDPFEVIRFYKQFDGNLERIEHQFRKMVVWRVENGMDDFLTNYGQPDPLFHYMPVCILNGHDKDGDPIYIDRMGVCDYLPLLRHFGPDGMLNYITFLRELNSAPQFWQQSYEKKAGHKVKSYTVIIDLEGLNTSHMRPSLLALWKRVARLSQESFPGWAKRILIIRAPPVFKLIWSTAKKFLSPQARAKIFFALGSDHLPLLDKYVDRKVLPSVICPDGGHGKVVSGYYENVKLEGGSIPKEAFQRSKRGESSSMRRLVPVFSPCYHGSRFQSHTTPMPQGSNMDECLIDRPPSPLSTTLLLLGHLAGDPVKSHSSKGGQMAARHEESKGAYIPPEKSGWQSPMFTYNW